MYDLAKFRMSDMIECSSSLRRLGEGAQSMEEVANKIVRHLYDNLTDLETGLKACALVRLYKTHKYGELDPELRGFARSLLGNHAESPEITCLTLLATAGEKPEWNSRKNSAGHKAIPLPSEQVITKIPMISQLVRQLGLELSDVVRPNPALMVELEEKTFNVFHVPDAHGSPFVPAQNDFVIPFEISSALGFGGMLPKGDLFAIIMFSKVHIPRETADMFKTVALSVKIALLPFVGGAVFA